MIDAVRPFSELEASRLYARLVNDLDPEPFIARLAPDVHYCSHWVIDELEDKVSVAKLLRGKVQTIRKAGNAPNEVILGVATRDGSGMPLAIVLDQVTQQPEATATFKISKGLISDIAISILPVMKPAVLDNPDTYAWPPAPLEGASAAQGTARYVRRRQWQLLLDYFTQAVRSAWSWPQSIAKKAKGGVMRRRRFR